VKQHSTPHQKVKKLFIPFLMATKIICLIISIFLVLAMVSTIIPFSGAGGAGKQPTFALLREPTKPNQTLFHFII
jgi:hypothetical protein